MSFNKAKNNTFALAAFNVYKNNRSLFLNSSYILLITAAFSGATNTSSKRSKREDVSKDVEKKKTKVSKEAGLRLFRAAIPSWTDLAVMYLGAHLVLLVVRAYLTIKVASLDGKLVGALVSKRLKMFGRLLAIWMLIGFPASVVNSLLTWTRNMLRRSLRRNMNDSIMEDYLPDNLDPNYYSLIQLSDNKVNDPDQRISTDVARLAQALSSLPGQLLKPTLDMLLCARELSKSGVGSGEGSLALGIIAHFSTII